MPAGEFVPEPMAMTVYQAPTGEGAAAPTNRDPIEQQDFYHGFLPREDVCAMLVNKGDFLVRTTEMMKNDKPRQYCLSVFWDVRHHLLLGKNANGRFTVEINVPGAPDFVTVGELITYYSENMRAFFPQRIVLLHPVCRQEWELLHDRIETQTKLGEGSFSVVHSGQLRLNNLYVDVAIRQIKTNVLTKEKIEELMDEARLMRDLRHPHVVRLYGVAAEMEPLVIITELMPDGSLDSYLKSKTLAITVNTRVNMCLDASLGLAYIHQIGLVHRGISANSCLYGNRSLKISGFSFARKSGMVTESPEKLSARWLAPEVFTTHQFRPIADVWALGVLIWEVFTNAIEPYRDFKEAEIKEQVTVRNFRLSFPEWAPKGLVSLVQEKMWAADPNNRMTSKLIAGEMEKLCTTRVSTYVMNPMGTPLSVYSEDFVDAGKPVNIGNENITQEVADPNEEHVEMKNTPVNRRRAFGAKKVAPTQEYPDEMPDDPVPVQQGAPKKQASKTGVPQKRANGKDLGESPKKKAKVVKGKSSEAPVLGGSKEVLKGKSKEPVSTGGRAASKSGGSKEALKGKNKGAATPKGKSKEALSAGSKEAVPAKSKEALSAGSKGAVPAKSKEALSAVSKEAVPAKGKGASKGKEGVNAKAKEPPKKGDAKADPAVSASSQDDMYTSYPRFKCPFTMNGTLSTHPSTTDDALLPVLIFIDDHRLPVLKREAIRYTVDSVICLFSQRVYGFTLKVIKIEKNGQSRIAEIRSNRMRDVFPTLYQWRMEAEIADQGFKIKNESLSCAEQISAVLEAFKNSDDHSSWFNHSLSAKLLLLFDESGNECAIDHSLYRLAWFPEVMDVKHARWDKLFELNLQQTNKIVRTLYIHYKNRQLALDSLENIGRIKRVTLKEFHKNEYREQNALENAQLLAAATITNGMCLIFSMMFTLLTKCFICGMGCAQSERLAADHLERHHRLGIEVDGQFRPIVPGAPFPEGL
ncbi:hypothetical protein QR680_014182 [Steinernema hermaphroditum]|uniref:Tyrosine-protein kinase n=1 Tax=Steinernema hermaphroditum TaxID=289476 RepID=A0AA39I7Z5_9BILA|nr:hypothetical protein QR680_014182 [Steinernema hermaphroditum]